MGTVTVSASASGNSLTLPDDFSELFIMISPSIGYRQSFTSIRNVLSSTITNFALGFAGTSSQFIKVGVSLTEVELVEVSYGESDKTSGSSITVYYR